MAQMNTYVPIGDRYEQNKRHHRDTIRPRGQGGIGTRLDDFPHYKNLSFIMLNIHTDAVMDLNLDT